MVMKTGLAALSLIWITMNLLVHTAVPAPVTSNIAKDLNGQLMATEKFVGKLYGSSGLDENLIKFAATQVFLNEDVHIKDSFLLKFLNGSLVSRFSKGSLTTHICDYLKEKNNDYDCSDSQLVKKDKIFLNMHNVVKATKDHFLAYHDSNEGICSYYESVKDLIDLGTLSCNNKT
ncbi:PREDICTED: uncharacterized protein LOC109583127 [Amphimedon queenslandica]|uniref:Secreted protein n=1 Tax=Amphimedon queenslandica TaxID=400682 RepID=A0AAN0JB17_AMPQE|nr:PREDICTED: uncharacterized protein LOC109583127 [Amphimedon queenslandica]|eukprot:XP_019853883.1 PREDICTED: uncharacterized protein LOC109583127 [Amphimedon queenslandica]